MAEQGPSSVFSDSRSFHLELIHNLNQVFSGSVKAITFYRGGDNAQITILANHAPLATTINNGNLSFVPVSGKLQKFSITHATFSFAKNKASIFATDLKSEE